MIEDSALREDLADGALAPEPAADESRGWPGLAARALVAAAIVGYFVWQSFYDHAADFKSFYSAGYAVRHPEIPLYDLVALDENPFGEVFKLAPPAAVYLVPLSFGSIQQARLAWRVLLTAAFVVAWVVLARMLGVRALSVPWLLGLAAWSIFAPLQIAVGEGQWDPLLLLLLAGSTAAVSNRRPLVAALAIAVSASIKPYPLLLGGFFVARGWWRSAMVTAGLLSMLMLAGCAVIGVEESIVFLTRVLPASGATTAYADNQALGGVLARLWSNDLKPFPLRDSGSIDLVIKVLALALTAVTIWMVHRAPATDPLGRALQLSIFAPLSILVIPAAWSHYQAILLVPLTLVVVQWWQAPRPVAAWLLLAAIYLLLLLPNPSVLYGAEIDRGLWLRSRADNANLALQRIYPTPLDRLILSYKTLGVVLLYGVVAWHVARWPDERDAPAGTAAPEPARVRTPL